MSTPFTGAEFHRLTMRTAASNLHPEKIELTKLCAGMAGIIGLARALDLLKKGLVYGKDIDADGFANALYEVVNEDTAPFTEEDEDRINLDAVPADVTHAILGIVTEAGELAEAWLKAVLGKQPLDLVNAAEETGDIDWYQELLARGTGIAVDDARARVIAKLVKRYGDKFSEDRALVRNLDAERAALEGNAEAA